jgi:hypothetical protein
MFKKKRMLIEIGRAQLAQEMFNLRRRPLRFKLYPHMVDIINDQSRQMLLKCGRQVAKSTTLSILELTNVAYSGLGATELEPDGVAAIRQVFVSPSQAQTTQFLKEKIRPLITESPNFSTLFRDKDSDDDVSFQSFTTGAQLNFRAAYRDAERVRGIPADEVHLDEIQSMLKANVPIILACTENSSYARKVFTGTPLSETNLIEEYWKKSTQTEWVVPCHAHSPVFWNILTIDNIGKNHLICKKCGKQIFPGEGRWVDTVDPENATMKGFHINQLGMVKKQQPDDWAELVDKMENWREDQFYNEVLGESAGQVNRPITQKMLQEISFPKSKSNTTGWNGGALHKSPPTKKTIYFAGVDWGEGRELASMESGKKHYASFTHFVISAYDVEGRFRPVHWKKFRGKETDPEFIIPYIIRMVRLFNCHMVGSDYGFGWGMNSRLMAELGKNRVIPILHSGNIKALYRWDPEGWKMILNRNAFISRLINDIKFGNVAFPLWDNWAQYAEDFMAIYGEYNHRSNTIRYDHSVQEPDDGLHAFLYSKFVADKSLNRIPNITEGIQ